MKIAHPFPSMPHTFFKKHLLFLALILSSTVLSCSDPSVSSLALLQPYFTSLPEEESINASLYHYELLVDEASHAYQDKQYLKVLTIYQTYLDVFYESEVTDESELLHYTGMSLHRLCQEKDPHKLLAKLAEKDPHYLAFLGIKTKELTDDDANTTWQYSYRHLKEIIESRLNYSIEWHSIQAYYKNNFIAQPQNKADSLQNFEHLYYLVTHFPNTSAYQEIITQDALFDSAKFSTQYKEKWESLHSILAVYEAENRLPLQNSPPVQKIIAFSKTGGLILRSRTSLIRSRNFARLAAWEPIILLHSLTGEDGQLWWRVQYKNSTEPAAYIPAQTGFFHQLETIEGQDIELPPLLLLPRTQTSPLSLMASHPPTSTAKRYLQAAQLFYQHDFIKSAEILSSLLLLQDQDPSYERSLTLFYRTLQEIAKRSTSIHNPYTRFIKKYPDYFNVTTHPHQQNSPPELSISPIFRKKIIVLNPRSAMLQYYGNN